MKKINDLIPGKQNEIRASTATAAIGLGKTTLVHGIRAERQTGKFPTTFAAWPRYIHSTGYP
jgi:hypothetical protein